jgi:calcineurin-like phosphoesterase family protein
LLKEKLIVDDNKKAKQEELRTEKVIALHNKRVKKNDYCFILGDIQESELKEGNDILELKSAIERLNGTKFLICGNNDVQKWDFYMSCGFEYVSRSPITTKDYILSHEPIDIKPMGVRDGYINIHGHIHQHRSLYNVESEGHINVYWKDFNGPLRLSEYIKLYQEGKLPKNKTIYQ